MTVAECIRYQKNNQHFEDKSFLLFPGFCKLTRTFDVKMNAIMKNGIQFSAIQYFGSNLYTNLVGYSKRLLFITLFGTPCLLTETKDKTTEPFLRAKPAKNISNGQGKWSAWLWYLISSKNITTTVPTSTFLTTFFENFQVLNHVSS